jgi:hypothetical protein
MKRTMDEIEEAGWQNAFNVMKTNYSLTDDAVSVFAINLRFNLDDIQTIVSEAITGGGDDKKCDVLYVDKEREIAVIAQCYISQKTRDAAPANKASDLNTALTWLLLTDLDNLPDALKGRADELRSAITTGEIKQFYIWYVHNLPCSKNVQDELRAVEDTARAALKRYPSGQDINIFAEEICDSQLDRLYMQAERTVIVTDPITMMEAYPVVPGSSRFSVWAGWLPRLARGLNRPVGSPLPSYAAVAGVEPWRRRCEGWHGR